MQLLVHRELSHHDDEFRLNEAEAHSHDGHADDDVNARNVHAQLVFRLQFAKTDGAERRETEINAVEDAPLLQLMKQRRSARDVTYENHYANRNRHR